MNKQHVYTTLLFVFLISLLVGCQLPTEAPDVPAMTTPTQVARIAPEVIHVISGEMASTPAPRAVVVAMSTLAAVPTYSIEAIKPQVLKTQQSRGGKIYSHYSSYLGYLTPEQANLTIRLLDGATTDQIDQLLALSLHNGVSYEVNINDAVDALALFTEVWQEQQLIFSIKNNQ